jgi:6-phosphofructokinase 1
MECQRVKSLASGMVLEGERTCDLLTFDPLNIPVPCRFHDPENRPIELLRSVVDGVHLLGGTILGTCRGQADIKEIVKRIDLWGLNQLYVVGGNGGNAGAYAIHSMLREKEIDCCVVAVPKSIDNDILIIDRCFGFDLAVEEAQKALLSAKVEAYSAKNGIGLVKLMGRHSGFISVQASMASGAADVVLIPEVPFKIEAVMSYVESILKKKGHCVICVAEGAGQDLIGGEALGKDLSGNIILKDIGPFIKAELKKHLPRSEVRYIGEA